MKVKPRELTASDITETAKLLLTAKGYRVWRQVNTTTHRRRHIVTSGVPDIIGYHRITGIFVGCEVKKKGDTFYESQIDFLMQLHAAGGTAFYATELNGEVVLKEITTLNKN